MNRPHTPGAAGYLIGVCVSFLVCAPLILVYGNAGLGPAEWLVAVLYLPFAVMEISVFGLPVALAGVVLLELTCRRVPWQWVHVLVAGVCAGGLGWAWTEVTHLDRALELTPPYSVLAGVAAAVGRAAVIPLVVRRRAGVERDFRPAA